MFSKPLDTKLKRKIQTHTKGRKILNHLLINVAKDESSQPKVSTDALNLSKEWPPIISMLHYPCYCAPTTEASVNKNKIRVLHISNMKKKKKKAAINYYIQ